LPGSWTRSFEIDEIQNRQDIRNARGEYCGSRPGCNASSSRGLAHRAQYQDARYTIDDIDKNKFEKFLMTFGFPAQPICKRSELFASSWNGTSRIALRVKAGGG